MEAFDPGDVSEVLKSRGPILAALSVEEKTPAELAAELSVSRSTIDRGLRELERSGFVEVVDGTARATLFGRLALESYADLVGQLAEIDSAADAFESLPADTQFDPVMVDGSRSVVAETADDERPLDRLTSFFDRATAIRGCVRTAAQPQIETFSRRIVDDDIAVSLVATSALVEQLITEHRPQLVTLLGTGSFSLRSIDSLPYSLFVVELPTGPVALLVTYRSGRIFSVVSNDSSAAVAWTQTQLDRWWSASESLPLSPPTDE
ncbi:helix-turn-helix transcriptional regulator [Haloferax sp. DFSO52]|uniref:helix-turn-helix transcriptional regulator n=1 Tax=Haloferax sp. DFSO52 TaxID=3388505 RepID=UPI003A88E32B